MRCDFTCNLLLLAFCILSSVQLSAQCATKISSFPYIEDFEASRGNWVAGGTNSDWTWGTPNKNVISAAGSGTRCWITGGLTGSGYNDREESWLRSPCFDFTNLQYPYISFLVFWETEQKFDGANLQYSTNNGASWNDAGSVNDAVNCLNDNWFNSGNINNIVQGWAGNIQPTVGQCLGGAGKGNWVSAKHTFPNLGGRSSVIFRFQFGAGSTCNNYDGFAFDKFTIQNAPPNVADFSYNCTSSKTVAFTNLSANCPTSYQWNFGDPGSATNTSTQKDPVHTFSAAGNYTVTLTVAGPGNAPSTISKVVTILDVSAVVTAGIKCNGGNDGAISANVTGGNGNYSYVWNTTPVQTTNTITGLAAGTYSVTVTAPNSCPVSASATINQPAPLSHTVDIVSATCGNANGSASVVESGGSPPYTYLWSPTGGTWPAATNLTPGNYILTVYDSRSCMDTVQVQIDNIGGSLTAAISSKTDVSCFGASTGSASVSVTGSVGALTYEWLPNGGNGPVATNLKAGNYTVTVTDQSSGCSTTATVEITQPLTALDIGLNVKFASCGLNNGSAEAVVKGGVAPYKYKWTPGDYTTASIGGLATGNYKLTVEDAAGCEKDIEFTIGREPTITITTLQHKDVSCFGANNGTASVTAAGGNNAQPYTFTWTNGTTSYNGEAINNLGAGDYRVIVKDVSGCTTDSMFTIKEPAKLSLRSDVNNATCGIANGSATITPSGGTAPYSIKWEQPGITGPTANGLAPGTYMVTVTDANQCADSIQVRIKDEGSFSINVAPIVPVNCFEGNNGSATVNVTGNAGPFTYQWSSSNSTSSTANNLSAGPQTVTVRNSYGCTASITFEMKQPASALSLSISKSNTTCGLNNGKASALVSGGTAPYTYEWQGESSSTPNLTNLEAGVYVLEITDANGCRQDDQANIEPSSSPQITSLTSSDVLCNGASTGAANVAITNGLAPFTYTWTRGAESYTGNPLQNVTAGNYQLNIKDAAGCLADTSIIIKQPGKLLVTGNSISASCGVLNGSATVAATGGTAPYSFRWAHAAITTSTANGLAEGDYKAWVTDANQCTDSVIVRVGNAGNLSVAAASVTDVRCFGDSTGSATIIATGNNGPFTYNWLPYGGTGSTGTNLSAGNYIVTVSDVNGCRQTANVQVAQPLTPLTATLTHNNTSCEINNGNAAVTVAGGTPAYSYLWQPGSLNTPVIKDLAPGLYSVLVKDAEGCSMAKSIAVQPSTKPKIDSVIATNVLCNGGQTGAAEAFVTGGKAPYDFIWNSGNRAYTSNVIMNLPAGGYGLTVKDDAGCTARDSLRILEPERLSINVIAAATSCGLNNGRATVSVAGGVPSYSYLWSTGSTESTADKLPGGIHSVIVKDANGCSTSNGNVTIERSNALMVSLGRDTSICPGENVVLAPGSFASYRWQNNTTQPAFTATSAGRYSVTVTDGKGCTAFDEMRVEINCNEIVFPSAFTPNGDARNDGFGPLGTLGAVSGYTLTIYNRWGQVVFTTTNPFLKWDGRIKGVDPGTGTFTWFAEYTFNGQAVKLQKGTLTLIR